jgi:hypothetical protein
MSERSERIISMARSAHWCTRIWPNRAYDMMDMMMVYQ